MTTINLVCIIRCNIEEAREFLREGDVLVVDRGFRDSLDMLEDLGINAKMPSFMSKGQKQFPVEEANETRLITKVMYVY
jgi:hypothetical protein